ncbi:putative metalloprotease CJM1_0395 family protein [Roseospira marina]|nr:putative metalloprotease CJM1_0395 family protein [Roseospira marina]
MTIVGSAPSLSTEMIGVFGGLDGDGGAPASQTKDQSRATRRPIDPLTGRPVEIDPFTGKPVFTDPADVEFETPAAGSREGGEDATGADGLTDAERAEVRRLAARDREVRQHEAAHKAAGGGVTGPATYTFVTGPDGKQYAVAGEVPITVNTASGDPEQVIRDMEQVRRAALAPSDPSPADRAAAASAQAAITQAEQDLRSEEQAAEAEEAAEDAAADTGAREVGASGAADTATATSAASGGSANPGALTAAIEAYRGSQSLPERGAVRLMA